jgi:alkylated DNA repair dioxygenase AlkB
VRIGTRQARPCQPLCRRLLQSELVVTHIRPLRVDLRDGAWIDLWPALVPEHEAYLERLRAELPLTSEQYRIAGRSVTAPRLVSWHGDPGTDYVYSGVRHSPQAWTPALAELRELVEEASGLTFNSALANYYRHGGDSMGWHADAEPEVGPAEDDRWVASLSLGAPRRFVLRHRRKRDDRREFALGEGCLLVMRGTTQSHYRHAAPRTAREVGERLNLTFRHIRVPG